MKTLILIVTALALSYGTPRAQGRGHAYGRYKHEERIERAAPAVRIYSVPRVYTYQAPATRVYTYRRPGVTFNFPFGYSTYQPYQRYYYPYSYTSPRVRREHEEEEEHEHAQERRER